MQRMKIERSKERPAELRLGWNFMQACIKGGSQWVDDLFAENNNMKSTDESTNKKNKLNPTDGIKARMKENYKMASHNSR